METVERFRDYGNIILEIDKLVRNDRDLLYGNVRSQTPRANCAITRKDTHYELLTKPGMTEEPCTDSDAPIFGTLTHRRTSGNLSGSLESLIGEPETPVESEAQKDMRQVRLFKTRFCSYGSECPYLMRGKCLYAHNRDEIRFRPPPPPSYKAATKKAGKSSPVSTPRSVPINYACTSKSVWALPESAPTVIADPPASSSTSSYSLFDFMPPRTSTTVNYSEFPSL
jgi:hypothetical protein